MLQSPNAEIRIQEDIVFVKTRGETTLADLEAIFRVYDEVRRKHGHVLALYDGTLGRGISSEARRELNAAASIPERGADAAALFGAPFAIRALVNMLDRAFVALHRKPLGVKMLATEHEARSYLDNERRRLLTTRSVAIQS